MTDTVVVAVVDVITIEARNSVEAVENTVLVTVVEKTVTALVVVFSTVMKLDAPPADEDVVVFVMVKVVVADVVYATDVSNTVVVEVLEADVVGMEYETVVCVTGATEVVPVGDAVVVMVEVTITVSVIVVAGADAAAIAVVNVVSVTGTVVSTVEAVVIVIRTVVVVVVWVHSERRPVVAVVVTTAVAVAGAVTSSVETSDATDSVNEVIGTTRVLVLVLVDAVSQTPVLGKSSAATNAAVSSSAHTASSECVVDGLPGMSNPLSALAPPRTTYVASARDSLAAPPPRSRTRSIMAAASWAGKATPANPSTVATSNRPANISSDTRALDAPLSLRVRSTCLDRSRRAVFSATSLGPESPTVSQFLSRQCGASLARANAKVQYGAHQSSRYGWRACDMPTCTY